MQLTRFSIAPQTEASKNSGLSRKPFPGQVEIWKHAIFLVAFRKKLYRSMLTFRRTDIKMISLES